MALKTIRLRKVVGLWISILKCGISIRWSFLGQKKAITLVRTLGGILDSQYSGVQRSLPFLAPFYEEKDLRVEIDRGFYQKPFIGAAVMSVFAESLHDENSPGGKACALTSFHNTKTNFFLCGSLHGGTGACGVPVLGEYLSTLKKKKENQNWDWSVGACLLTPYCVPPQPPFGQIRDRVPSADEINDLVKAHGDKPAFSGLAPEEKVSWLTRFFSASMPSRKLWRHEPARVWPTIGTMLPITSTNSIWSVNQSLTSSRSGATAARARATLLIPLRS